MKTAKLTYLLLLAIFLLNSCKEEQTVAPTGFGFKTPIISGFWMRDNNGSPMGYYGNPNIKTTTIDGLEMHCFPNPACNFWSIYFDNNNTLEKKIWIVEASVDPDANLPSYTLEMLVENIGGIPLYEATTHKNYIHVDARMLGNGYYRVYCQIGDIILYDNLVRDNSMYYCGNK